MLNDGVNDEAIAKQWRSNGEAMGKQWGSSGEAPACAGGKRLLRSREAIGEGWRKRIESPVSV